ncbi:hypothetical protein Fcan01_10047 [Folsomia candida]|uniref:Uncharacterized protein n=1 Tax=Folsomia candida TaxID=158441 RepID=A0A226ECJ7_FOLCA|nr:hypothetical protein Fcan01_10047 [Folsomia candida]
MDQNKMISELQRQDSNIPLQGFSFPRLKASAALSTIGVLFMFLIERPDETDIWWQNRFKNDFDYYYMRENPELIQRLWPLWKPFAKAVIVAEAVYFVTGMMVVYALIKKTVHPYMYMPWIVMTTFLCSVMWIMAFVMIIAIFVLLTYRPLTVTWDVGPIACVIVYNVAWTYSGFVIIAHYKRRWIVKYWRDRGMMMGTDTMSRQPGEGSGY